MATPPKDKKSTTSQAASLRTEAEARLSASGEIPESLSPEEALRTFHELRVCQIELEMQNEELRRAQEELGAARARYFDLYNLAPVGYCTLGEKGLILEANLALATQLRTARGELAKGPLSRFVLKEDQDTYYLHHKRLLETGEPQGWDLRMVRKDGTALWAHLAATVSQDEKGAPVSRIVLSDITERKRAEAALRASESQFRSVLETVSLVGVMLDLDGNIILCNDYLLGLTGWTREEVLHRSWFDLFIPEDIRAQIRNEVFLNTIRSGEVPPHYQNAILTRTGERRLVDWSNAVLRDERGDVSGVASIGQDITERTRTEAALIESEEKYRLLVDVQTDLVVKVDREGRFLFVSPSYCAAFGRSEKALLGQSFMPLVHPDDQAATAEAMKALYAPPNQAYMEQRAMTRTGWRWFGWQDAAILDPRGGVAEIVGVGRDITERRLLEDALRESEERFRTLFMNAPMAYQALDVEGRFLEVNDAWLATLGYTRDEVIGRWFSDFLAPGFQEHFGVNFPKFKAAGEILGVEFQMVRKDGTQILVSFNGKIGHDEAGQFKQTHCVLRDITAQRRAEEERDRLFTVLEASLNEIYMFDPNSLKFTYVNGSARANLGYSMGELARLTPVDLKSAFTEASFRAMVDPLLENAEAALTFSTLHLRKDGTHYPVEVHLQLVKAGERPVFLALIHDITDRLQVEETVLVGRERYRSLVETAGSAIILMDPHRCILEWNREAERVFGYRREEVLGQDYLRMFIPDALQPALGREIEKVLEGEPLLGYENAVVRKDGAVRTILWNATRLPGTGGEVEGLLCIGHDITERRKAEQQVADLNKELEQQVRDRTARLEMANRELEAFSYSVSHDLKAPLRAIEGLAQALAEDHGGTLDDQGRLLLAAIRSNTRRMGRLIADLLAFSKVTRMEMAHTEVDMTDLARSVYIEIASPRALEAARFAVSGLPPAWGDPALLHQVWTNLLSNALKFTSGTASPSIEISGEELDGKTLYRVKDNGAGFDMEYAHKLFKVFQRLHSEAEFEGTGVGLALVQRIVHRHGGSVWAEGQPGEGAVFSFALPSKEARRD